MLDEIQNHPNADVVNVDTGIYYDCLQDLVDETAKLGYDAVVNCTGLGSKAICDDDSLIGARGILLDFDRKCERLESDSGIELSNDAAILVEDSPFGVEDYPCYLIPRGDKIVVGGSYIENDTLTSIRDTERTRLTTNARLLGIDTSKSKPLGEWTGFRPYRPTVRLEIDSSIGKEEDITLVHNYGHGGSGWTVFIGAATEVTSLLVKAS
jgi:D-amino-acid oxidase